MTLKKMKRLIPVFFITVISIFFRFYNFTSLFHFTMDEEFWSYVPLNIATGYHFPLIGGNIAGTGLYTGPLFVYLMAIPAFIFQGNPLGFGFTVSCLGVVTSVLIFILGKKMFNSKVAIISAFIYSASFLAAIFDRHYWNASLTPFLSLLTMFFLYKIVSRKEYIYYLPLSFILALGFHAHGTGIVLIIASAFTLIIFRAGVRNKFFMLGIVLFLFMQLPLLAFDLRHNFLNFRAGLSYIQTPRQDITQFELLSVPRKFAFATGRLIYFPSVDLDKEQSLCSLYQKTPPANLTIILALALSLGGAVIVIRKRSIPGIISLSLIGSTLFGLQFFKEKISEYYFNPTIVPTIFLIGIFLSKLAKRKLSHLILAFFLCTYLYLNLTNLFTVSRKVTFDARMEAVRKSLKTVRIAPFSLDVESTDQCQIYGFRYLYSFLGKEPSKSYMDPYFLWFYKERIPDTKPVYRILLKINDGKISQNITKLTPAGD